MRAAYDYAVHDGVSGYRDVCGTETLRAGSGGISAAVDAAEYNVVVTALVLCRQNVFADNGVAVYNYVGRAYVRNGLPHPRAINVIIRENAPADNRIADKAGGNGYPGGTDGSLSLFGRKAAGYDIVYISATHRYCDAIGGKRSVFVPEFRGAREYSIHPVGAFRRGNLTSRDVYID